MTDFSVTVPGSHPQFAAIVALLMGSAAPAALAAPAAAPSLPVPPMPISGGNDDDDDTGDGVPGAPAPDVTGVVDKDGLPWDERIHASTKAANADGTWRKKRKVDAATIAAVEAELRAAGATPAVAAPVPPVPAPMPIPAVPMPVAPAVAAPVPPVPVAPPLPPMGGATVAPPMPPAVAAPPAPVPPMPAPEPAPVVAPPAGPMDFAGFMAHLSTVMTKKDGAGNPVVDADYLGGITNEVSTAFTAAGHITTPLTAITDIASNPAMIEYTVALLNRDGKWTV